MLKYLKEKLLSKSAFPVFKLVTLGQLTQHEQNAVYGPVRLLPMVQKHPLSDEVKRVMRFFSRQPEITSRQRKQLTQTVLLQALRIDQQIFGSKQQSGLLRNYNCLPSPYCPFHGVADFLLFTDGGKILLPVLFFDEEINEPAIIAVARWRKSNNQLEEASGKRYKNCSLGTDGRTWILCQIEDKTELSMPYRAPGKFGRLYESEEAVQVAVGLVRAGLGKLEFKELMLQQYYKLVDQQAYMSELPRRVDQPPLPRK